MVQLRRSASRVPRPDGVHPSRTFLAAQHPLSPAPLDDQSQQRFLTPFSPLPGFGERKAVVRGGVLG